jgi:hypothetical protein
LEFSFSISIALMNQQIVGGIQKTQKKIKILLEGASWLKGGREWS